jgi:secondary thiamine-phosphate synthase enzyme
MEQHQESLTITTAGSGLVEVTAEVGAVVARSGFVTGLATVFLQHCSASLCIQENADPSARADIEAFMARIAPEGRGLYSHSAEGPDDMPAHLRSLLTRSSEQIPVVAGALGLGTWQGLYLFEHRRRPHTRRLVVHVIGAR